MFSVVIPLYNKELSIKNTIQSVLNQNYQNFEIIVVNDGSTDGSAKIVESIDDNRIHFIQQKNKGVSAARNRGIQEANNEWIAFLDADDLWNSDHLQEIMTMIQKYTDEKVFVTSFEYSDKRTIFRHPRNDKYFKIDNYFKEAIKEELIWTSIVVIHKNCFEKVGGFNEKLNRGEDLDLWSRLAREYDIVKSKSVTAIYRIDAENRTSLSKNIIRTHVYNFNLEIINNADEKNYYKFLIFSHLYQYLRILDLKNFIKLKKQHPDISYYDISLVIIKNLLKKIK